MPDTPDEFHKITDVDAAIAAAKDRFDHAEAPYDPDALALIRAAEAMREALDSDGGRFVVLRMPAHHWSQIITNLEKFCGTDATDIGILGEVETIRDDQE